MEIALNQKMGILPGYLKWFLFDGMEALCQIYLPVLEEKADAGSTHNEDGNFTGVSCICTVLGS
jgi:hypothetical protein